MRRLGLALLLSTSVLWLGCESPIQDDVIDALGPELDGVPEGPLHRYGQPCLACHDAYGGAVPTFSAAGTVFATPNDDIPAENVFVLITDATGKQFPFPSNCAGNFYFDAELNDMVFPLRAEIECTLPDGTKRRNVMGTRINRDGSCASCHDRGGPTADSPGQIFCVPEQPEVPFEADPTCVGGPGAGAAP